MRLFIHGTGRGFARDFLAYGVSEIAAKLSRIMVVIAVARSMDVAQIGVAAAALAAGDILKALSENGVGQRIIAAPAHQLEQTCNRARQLFQIWCCGLSGFQMLVAALIYLSGAPELALLIAILGLEYLFMPAGLVQAALAMREGKLQQTAAIAGGQVVGANLATVLLALVWPSSLALVLPRLLAAPIWLICMRRLRPWHPNLEIERAPLRPFVSFGSAVIGIELVKVLRVQADKLIVGFMLGAEALGLYFMAFNAGLSLATSVSQAFSTALFPHLCAAPNRQAALRQSLTLTIFLIIPFVLVQSLLAPAYVPLLLGAGWGDITEAVSILCLAAIPGLIWAGCAGLLRAEGRPQTELKVGAGLAAALALSTAVLAPYGVTAMAWGYLTTSTLIMLACASPILIDAFLRPQNEV